MVSINHSSLIHARSKPCLTTLTAREPVGPLHGSQQ